MWVPWKKKEASKIDEPPADMRRNRRQNPRKTGSRHTVALNQICVKWRIRPKCPDLFYVQWKPASRWSTLVCEMWMSCELWQSSVLHTVQVTNDLDYVALSRVNKCRVDYDIRSNFAHCIMRAVPLHENLPFCSSIQHIHIILPPMQICWNATKKFLGLCAEQRRQYFKIQHTLQMRCNTTAEKSALHEELKTYLGCSAYSEVICLSLIR